MYIFNYQLYYEKILLCYCCHYYNHLVYYLSTVLLHSFNHDCAAIGRYTINACIRSSYWILQYRDRDVNSWNVQTILVTSPFFFFSFEYYRNKDTVLFIICLIENAFAFVITLITYWSTSTLLHAGFVSLQIYFHHKMASPIKKITQTD